MQANDSIKPRSIGTKKWTFNRNPDGTRAAILAAATREFAEKGFAGARIDLIASHARTNKRILNHYFGDKEALYLVVLEEAYAGIRGAEATLDLGQRDPEEGLRELALFTWRYFVAHPEFLSLLRHREPDAGAIPQRLSTPIRAMQTNLLPPACHPCCVRGEGQGI